MKGLIMIGYQGIGKSSCAGKNGCIDLESSNFFIGDKRSEDWYIPYCQIAMHLANQGYTVFTSSHKVVREQLASMPLLPNVGKVVVFCPKSRFKTEWIQRLQERYDKTRLDKDYKALMNAKDRYTENIRELFDSGFPVYYPAWMDYDLMDYVNKARHDWCEVIEPKLKKLKVPEKCGECKNCNIAITGSPYCRMEAASSVNSQMDISTIYVDVDSRPVWCPIIKMNDELDRIPFEKRAEFEKLITGLSSWLGGEWLWE